MMSLSEFLPQCMQYLQRELPSDQFQMWAGRLTASESDEAWTFFANNDFVLRLVRENFLPKMNEFKANCAPDAPPIVFRVGKGEMEVFSADENEKKSEITHEETTVVNKQTSHATISTDDRNKNLQDGHLNPEYTFSNLVVGDSNEFAHAISVAISKSLGEKNYNPFFLYGGPGLGKTHLVHAIGNHVNSYMLNVRIRYVHAERYLNDYLRAVRNQSFEQFKRYYHSLDLLILDDVQFLAGKAKTMEEFFYLFNSFLDDSKQVILTSDRLPNEIENLDDRLKSRFSWGISAQIKPPELEMRVAILQKKAEAVSFTLPESTAFFIAEHVRSSVRDLEGALKRLRARCIFSGVVPDISVAKETLQDIIAVGQRQYTPDQIQKTVASFYSVRLSELLSKTRKKNIALPRQVAMSLCKELTTLSLVDISEAFGRNDHTTVMHACKKIQCLIDEDAQFAQDYDTLKNILQN
ncbi:MAG: chromosomal replication initiator protein DnaA [Neisseriaceae bacterium]|nr:chromosomal replication initiator protein DnaA [Neisseriaceae bacterium]